VAELVGLTRADGRPLPLWARLFHVGLGGPRPVRDALAYTVPRLVAPRLPATLFRYADGRSFVLPAGDASYSQLFTEGAFEPAETEAIRRLLRSGDLALDVGANLGWFTVLMAVAVGSEGRVWAIEPMPGPRATLEENLARNPGLSVRVLPLALGAKRGEIELNVFAGLPHGHASVSTLGRDDYTAHRVEQRTLDEIVAEAAETPALVKMDVEGSELGLLEGARATLAGEAPPVVVTEVNYETSGAVGYRPVELLERLPAAQGYETYRIVPGGLAREREPEAAPHGAGWALVPAARRDRLVGLVRAET
jgi:FkbM family methyltransferase